MSKKNLKRALSPSNTRNGRSKVAKKEDTSVCGIIQKISIENFMCHGEFTWTPNQNINFIIGQNGSGKSSILQAIVLGLLADSKHTKRYTKLGDFVQKGKKKADIKITLKNEGEDAYRQEVYGPSIVFSRSILDSGQSSVKILNHQNQEVNKNRAAREEGRRILDNFRINTDNPIVILQQEEAKELLRVESPTSLYDFFQKATLLKQCLEQYTDANKDLKKCEEMMKEKKTAIDEMGVKLQKQRKQVVEIQKSLERDKEEVQLEHEYVYASITEQREKKEELMDQIALRDEKKKKAREKLLTMNSEKSVFDNEMAEVHVQIEAEKRKSEQEENKVANNQIDIENLKKLSHSTLKKIKDLEKVKNEFEGEHRVLKEQVESMSCSDNLKKKREREQERKKKLKDLDAKTSEINNEIERRGIQRDELEKRVDEKVGRSKNIAFEKKNETTLLSRLEQEVDHLEKQGNQKLAIIDRFAPRVVEEIGKAARDQRFRISPIGPVGKYVQLNENSNQDENLKNLVETELGSNNLKSYLCDNDKDRKVLWDILKKVYGNQKTPQIFTSKFLSKRHNVHRVGGGHNTLMDFIEISGSDKEKIAIFNHLVDQKGIESIVIKGTQAEASKLSTYLRDVPSNMAYCITKDFYRFFPPTKTSSYRSYYFEKTPTRILGCDMNAKIREKRGLIAASKEKISKLTSEEGKIARLNQTTKKEIEELKTQIQDYREELGNNSKLKSKLKAEENNTDNLDSLQVKLSESKTNIDKVQVEIEKTTEERENVLKKLHNKTVEYNNTLKELSKLRESLAPFEVKKRQIEGKEKSKMKEILNQQRMVKGLEKEKEDLKKKVSAAEVQEKNLLKSCRDIAKKRKVPLEIIPSGTVAELSAKLTQIKKKKRNNPAQNNNLLDEFENLRNKYDDSKRALKDLEDWVNQLKAMNSERTSNYQFIRKAITQMVVRRFGIISFKFQEQFGTQITISIDHKKKELKFEFRDTDGDELKTEISSLSGGEKSYAQMCLIAALWDNMNPPFRALDEWDVFLDALNRKEISKTLLNFGLKQSDYQFFFISPQGAADVEVEPSDRAKVEIREVIKS